MAAISAREAVATADDAGRLTQVEADFALQIATAVWLCRFSDADARDVLGLYALAGRRGKPAQSRLWAALVAEYRHCRERQELCS
jgi:hypothetical protein